MKIKNGVSIYDIPEECDDAELVLISTGFLIKRYGFKRKEAIAIAERAFEICSARWPEAFIRVSDGKSIDHDNFPFIGFNYGGKIPHADIDMKVWDACGAILRSEIHDYILVRSCEEIGISLPMPKKIKDLPV